MDVANEAARGLVSLTGSSFQQAQGFSWISDLHRVHTHSSLSRIRPPLSTTSSLPKTSEPLPEKGKYGKRYCRMNAGFRRGVGSSNSNLIEHSPGNRGVVCRMSSDQ